MVDLRDLFYSAFLLFQEPAGPESFAIPQGAPEYGAALEERRSWSPIAFAEKHGLKLLTYGTLVSNETVFCFTSG